MSDLYIDIQYLLEAGITHELIAEKLGVPVAWVYRVEQDLNYSTHD